MAILARACALGWKRLKPKPTKMAWLLPESPHVRFLKPVNQINAHLPLALCRWQ